MISRSTVDITSHSSPVYLVTRARFATFHFQPGSDCNAPASGTPEPATGPQIRCDPERTGVAPYSLPPHSAAPIGLMASGRLSGHGRLIRTCWPGESAPNKPYILISTVGVPLSAGSNVNGDAGSAQRWISVGAAAPTLIQRCPEMHRRKHHPSITYHGSPNCGSPSRLWLPRRDPGLTLRSQDLAVSE